VIGTLGEKVGWHYGFGAAGIGMLIGLATYLYGRRHLPPDQIRKRGDTPKLTGGERKRVFAILLLLVPYVLYSAASQQAYAIMYVWADTAVDRKVLGWEVPVTWIGIADGLLTILGVAVANRIWIMLGKRKREPDDFTKMAIGYLGVGVAFLYAALIAKLAIVPVLLWIGFYLILDFSYGWSEPPVQSLISRDAPASVNAMMMATMKASTMLCYFIVGWVARFYEPLGPSLFWVLTGAESLGAVAMIVASKPLLLKLMEPEHVAAPEGGASV
jgi:POT family proton-dependent oligopeptide transporter